MTPVEHLVVPTEDVLSALTAELAVARAACARLDGALVSVLESASSEQRGTLLSELHAVDRLHQQMEALHTFLGRVGCGESLLEIGQALPAITLAEVAERMGAVLSVSAVSEPPPPVGDCEYF
ncbi:MAG: hypothetical protein ACOY5Y_08020 [Pseudomonadota bacterium]